MVGFEGGDAVVDAFVVDARDGGGIGGSSEADWTVQTHATHYRVFGDRGGRATSRNIYLTVIVLYAWHPDFMCMKTAAAARQQGRVLVVEDERDVAELIRYNLTKEGYDVIVAPTGADALKQAREIRPDLV